jgi:ferredoxin
MEYMLKKKDWNGFLDAVKKRHALWGPRRQGGQVAFGPVAHLDSAGLDAFDNSSLSPKEIFFPRSEIMLTFRKSGEDANIYKEVTERPSPRLVFGIRPCDAGAFSLLDRIFGNDLYSDTYWFAKRDATTLMGLGCSRPRSTCFCTSVGSHPFAERGLDILSSDLGDRYILKVLTPKGEKLLKGLSFLEDAQERDISTQEDLRREAENALSPRRFSIEKIEGKTALELFNQECWSEIQEPCLGCATCAYACPVCHCFDIQDEVFKDNGVRLRTWDTCMSWLFTAHASGHNPRGSAKDRVRQRFMHKFKYLPAKKEGDMGCVGCGRCISLCPVNIDIREVLRAMNT